MIAAEHRQEKFLLLGVEQVEAALAAAVKTSRLSDTFQLGTADRRLLHRRQGVEVAVVGGAGDGPVVVKVGHALVHGTPDQLAASPANPPTADFEFTRLIDDRLD